MMKEVEETRIGSDSEAADEVAQSGVDHKPGTEGFSDRKSTRLNPVTA